MFINTQEPFYNTVHYSLVSDITQFDDGPQNVVSKHKCIDYIYKCKKRHFL